MKKPLVIACALALGACAAQQSALQSTAGAQPQDAAESQETASSRRDEGKKGSEAYVPSLERRDMTGSRINRVRRAGEPDKDSTAGKRVETISREQLEDLGHGTVSEALPSGG